MKAYLKDKGSQFDRIACSIFFMLSVLLAAEFSSADESKIPWWAKSSEVSKLEYALLERDVALIEELLRSGVDPLEYQSQFNTSIYLKSFPDREFKEENLEIIRLLLSYQADINFGSRPDGCPPLFYIIGIGEPSVYKLQAVKLMLDFNASIDVGSRCPATLLQQALMSKEYKIAVLLIERGYIIDDRDYDDLARIRGQESMGYVLDAIDHNLLIENAEHFFFFDNPLFVKYLVEHESLPETIEVGGHRCFTPASYAAKRYKARILFALKSHGVNLRKDDCSGKDAYDYWPDLDKYLNRVGQGG